MQDELKSAIHFNDFVGYFGAPGVVALAWWIGAAHADRIRQEQNSFPFLQIVGAAGSGKTLLMDYLQKLNGETPHSHPHSLDHATPAARARALAAARQRVVICEVLGESEQSFDWDELKPLYNSGNATIRSADGQHEDMTFRGALVITANHRVDCSDAVSSRMVTVNLSTDGAHRPRVRPEVIADFKAGEASEFTSKVAESEDWIISTIQTFLPCYQGQLTRKYGAGLNARTALNCAQLICLIDLLCNLLSVSQDLQLEARKLVHDIAFTDTLPY